MFSFLDNVWPFTDLGSIRVEAYQHDGRFVVRAELPGIDPDKDAEITVDHGRLTVRREQHHGILEVAVLIDTVGQDEPTKIEIMSGKDARKK